MPQPPNWEPPYPAFSAELKSPSDSSVIAYYGVEHCACSLRSLWLIQVRKLSKPEGEFTEGNQEGEEQFSLTGSWADHFEPLFSSRAFVKPLWGFELKPPSNADHDGESIG